MLCWFRSARLLHLRFDRCWAIVCPSRKQSQPPAALLLNYLVAIAVPADSHLKPLPYFTVFFGGGGGVLGGGELRRQPCLLWVRRAPLAILVLLSWNGEDSHIFVQILNTCFIWTQSGKVWSVLHVLGLWVVKFCGNSAEGGATRRCLS